MPTPRRSSIVSSTVRTLARSLLERAQEVDDVLLLLSGELIETLHDFICLAIAAPVGLDSLHQIASPSVVEEKDALPDTPSRAGRKPTGASPPCLVATPKPPPPAGHVRVV